MAFGAGCEEAYRAVFADDAPQDWCWLGYQGQKLVPAGTGTGGLAEMLATVDDAIVLYGFLRLNKTDDGGDSKRVKFVFITWVGETAPALKKGKVTMHKRQCAELFKLPNESDHVTAIVHIKLHEALLLRPVQGYHIEKQIYDREALQGLEQELDTLLKKAGGANYDLGNTRTGVQAGNAQDLKNASKNFFKQKEQETNLKSFVYDKGPLTKGITSCDLGGRAMVAPASEAKKNTVGYVPA
eukprot:SM000124S25948  [mRNA]  locus=s124:231059:232714:- [translate_table: standard]